MAVAISIKDIAIFKYLPAPLLQELKEEFKQIVLGKYEKFVNYGQEMPGLYLVVEGNVEVFTENFQELLTTLNPGATIGEMSLIANDNLASASLCGGEKGAKLYGCDKTLFETKILSDEKLAYCFFKGASELMADRLHRTNLVVRERIETAKNSIKAIMQDYVIINRIAGVMGTVDDMGCDIVEILGGSVHRLEEFIAQNPSIDTSSVKLAKGVIEKVILEDMQEIDKTSQKLGMILQFLENIQCTVNNEDVKEIKGDMNLFNSKGK